MNQATETGATPMYIAAEYDRVDVVQVLITAGADMNQAEEDGWTPMLTAAQTRKVGVVQALIKAGADVNAKAKDGCGMLMCPVAHCTYPRLASITQTSVGSSNVWACLWLEPLACA